MTVEQDEQLMRAVFAPARSLEPSEADVIRILSRADRQAKGKARRRRIGLRLPRGRWRLATFVLAGALVTGSAMAESGFWHPTIGDLAHDGPSSISESPVAPAVMNAIAPLRRPQTARDRAPDVEKALRTLSSYHLNGVHLDTVRYVAPGAGGQATILIVASESEGAPHHDAICVFNSYDFLFKGKTSVALSENCATPARIRDGLAVVGGGGPHVESIEGIVPDEVASVEVLNAHGKTIVPVRNNFFFVFRDPGYLEDFTLGKRGLVWRDAKGNVVPQPAEVWSPQPN
jgi:hypothetical protein